MLVMCTPQTGRMWSGTCNIGKQHTSHIFSVFAFSLRVGPLGCESVLSLILAPVRDQQVHFGPTTPYTNIYVFVGFSWAPRVEDLGVHRTSLDRVRWARSSEVRYACTVHVPDREDVERNMQNRQTAHQPYFQFVRRFSSR
jgi:hypothetical protein